MQEQNLLLDLHQEQEECGAGGYSPCWIKNIIDFNNDSSLGNATDFGDLVSNRK